MKKGTVVEWASIVAMFAVPVVVVTVLLLQPYFEARAYNKFTEGPKATYWDAMWTNLRVNSK